MVLLRAILFLCWPDRLLNVAGPAELFAARPALSSHFHLPRLPMNASSLVSLLVCHSWLMTAGPPGHHKQALPVTLPAATSSVTVVVSALASTESTIKMNFYNSSEGFLKRGQEVYQRTVRPEGKTSVTVPIELPQGEWAVALTQDLNNNDKLDKNFIGIPTEPYAFSNNVHPALRPPNFEECKFRVDAPGKVVSIFLVK